MAAVQEVLRRSLAARYRIERELGRGGMATVFLAEDLRHRRRVAVKVLDPELAAAVGPERFLREIETVASLTHPHILPLHDSGEAGGLLFYVMPFVEGESLRDRIAHEKQLPVEEALRIAGEVADALAYAHGRGVIHRDIKPENILLQAGHALVSDFGIARIRTATVTGPGAPTLAGGSLTATGATVGTPAYMSPEQAGGCRDVDGRSDQYALACVLYEMLAGQAPFTGPTVESLVHQHLSVVPRPVTDLRPAVPPRMARAISRALAKTPADRFAAMPDFTAALAKPDEASASATRAATAAVGRARAGHAGVGEEALESLVHTPGQRRRSEAPSLAVLYFENLSSEPDSDYFCAGITEDLLTDLSKVPGLKVASRNAVARYRGQTVDIPALADELGVGAVLEGGVRRAGNRLRITAQLINAADGFQLWAERYDRTIEDVFAVQEDIARSIAAALRVALGTEDAQRLLQGRPAAAAAYDHYLKGRSHYIRFTADDNRRALECFERALAIEPDYALAWAGIADACAQMGNKVWDMDPAWLARGLEAGERAARLDPSLAEAHKALALVHYTRGDPERAMQSAREAIRVNPKAQDVLDTLGWTSLVLGNVAAAERLFRRRIAMDPYDAYDYGALGHVLLNTRRYRECVDQLQHWQRLGPGTYYQTAGFAERAWALAYLGDLDAAGEEIRQARAAGLSGEYVAAAEALVSARTGQDDKARGILAQNEAERPDSYHAPLLLAEAAAFLGDAEAAVRVLRNFERIQTCHQKYWLYRIAPGLGRIRGARVFREWLGERGRHIVWPLEAPPLSPEERVEFSDYSEASGVPEGDEVV